MKRKAIVIDNAQISSLMVNIKDRQTVLNIMDLDHKEHRVVVLPSDTIAEVKDKVNLQAHPIILSDLLLLIKDDADTKLEDMAMVKDCNLVDGDKLELWSLECYAIMLKSRIQTRAAIAGMGAYLQLWIDEVPELRP
jgi:hypothetical protein